MIVAGHHGYVCGWCVEAHTTHKPKHKTSRRRLDVLDKIYLFICSGLFSPKLHIIHTSK